MVADDLYCKSDLLQKIKPVILDPVMIRKHAYAQQYHTTSALSHDCREAAVLYCSHQLTMYGPLDYALNRSRRLLIVHKTLHAICCWNVAYACIFLLHRL